MAEMWYFASYDMKQDHSLRQFLINTIHQITFQGESQNLKIVSQN